MLCGWLVKLQGGGKREEGYKSMICNPLCDPLGARTQDPNIKSVVLYQLS